MPPGKQGGSGKRGSQPRGGAPKWLEIRVPGTLVPTVDPNKERCEAVKLKIAKYLRRAEEIFNCHLQCTLGSGTSPGTVRCLSPKA